MAPQPVSSVASRDGVCGEAHRLTLLRAAHICLGTSSLDAHLAKVIRDGEERGRIGPCRYGFANVHRPQITTPSVRERIADTQGRPWREGRTKPAMNRMSWGLRETNSWLQALRSARTALHHHGCGIGMGYDGHATALNAFALKFSGTEPIERRE